MLKRYPLTRLKIDTGFVRALLKSSEDAAIVRAIINLAHSFDLDVIAEGVETSDQAAQLRKEGVEAAQRYLCSRTRSVAVLERQLERRGDRLYLRASSH